MQLRHVGIVCKNLSVSLDFYCNLLGFKVDRHMHETGSFISNVLGFSDLNIETIKLCLPRGGAQLELVYFGDLAKDKKIADNNTKIFNYGITHIAFKVDDLQDLYNKLILSQISFISKPLISEDKKARVCFCQDPDGVYIELVEIISSS